jgi:DNA polymerase III alpha subunit
VAAQVRFLDFTAIDHVTALARPGPLGGGATHVYIDRAAGRKDTDYLHDSMEAYLGDTFGVVLYQEQVMRIVRELGDFSWEQTTVIRKAMSGRKGKEFFDQQGATFVVGAAKHGIAPDVATELWNQLCNFGAWGMNKSHTVSYAIISYWCAYMKRYHPLEYAASCLRNAKDDEQTVEVLREMVAEGIEYESFDADRSEVNWAVKDGKLLGGYTNLVGIGPAKAVAYTEKRRLSGLDDKDRAKLAALPHKFVELRPAHAMWGHLYANPGDHAAQRVCRIERPRQRGGDLQAGEPHAPG